MVVHLERLADDLLADLRHQDVGRVPTRVTRAAQQGGEAMGIRRQDGRAVHAGPPGAMGIMMASAPFPLSHRQKGHGGDEQRDLGARSSGAAAGAQQALGDAEQAKAALTTRAQAMMTVTSLLKPARASCGRAGEAQQQGAQRDHVVAPAAPDVLGEQRPALPPVAVMSAVRRALLRSARRSWDRPPSGRCRRGPRRRTAGRRSPHRPDCCD